jgi:hypothetical protein
LGLADFERFPELNWSPKDAWIRLKRMIQKRSISSRNLVNN